MRNGINSFINIRFGFLCVNIEEVPKGMKVTGVDARLVRRYQKDEGLESIRERSSNALA